MPFLCQKHVTCGPHIIRLVKLLCAMELVTALYKADFQ